MNEDKQQIAARQLRLVTYLSIGANVFSDCRKVHSRINNRLVVPSC